MLLKLTRLLPQNGEKCAPFLTGVLAASLQGTAPPRILGEAVSNCSAHTARLRHGNVRAIVAVCLR